MEMLFSNQEFGLSQCRNNHDSLDLYKTFVDAMMMLFSYQEVGLLLVFYMSKDRKRTLHILLHLSQGTHNYDSLDLYKTFDDAMEGLFSHQEFGL